MSTSVSTLLCELCIPVAATAKRSQSLKWNERVANICSKLNKRLYFLKRLKRAGMSTGDLLCIYKSVIRPVAEYACPAWHSSLTVEQSNRIESFQKRALKIIMAALCNSGAIIFLPCNFYLLLSIFYLFSSPNLSGRRLDVYHTLTHGVALVRI